MYRVLNDPSMNTEEKLHIYRLMSRSAICYIMQKEDMAFRVYIKKVVMRPREAQVRNKVAEVAMMNPISIDYGDRVDEPCLSTDNLSLFILTPTFN